jgi:beta-glucosidase
MNLCRRSSLLSCARFASLFALTGALCLGCVGMKNGGGASASKLAASRSSVPTPDIEELIGKMTLEEKIGQMTQLDWKLAKNTDDVRKRFVGSVLNGAEQRPDPNTNANWVKVVTSMQTRALSTRLGIPMLWGTDAVHGNALVKGATVFPHNIGMGCTRNPELAEKVGRAVGLELQATGIPWAFAPCIAVPRDERWGRTYEGYGETPELAEMMGAAMIKGMQSQPGEPGSVLACAKHFLGDGGTAGGKDQGDTVLTEEQLRAIHLPGYAAAVKAGVASIMVSFSKVNGLPMHANQHLITDVLKGELHFEGFVVSDWEAIATIPGSNEQKIEAAINAGVDMAMVPNSYEWFIPGLRRLVEKNRVPMARIDDAVRRILKQKARFKLWEHPFPDPSYTGELGSPEHRALAREAVRQSAVLLKNQDSVLPLPKKGHILVVGSKADDMGIQCGGWTVGWNGRRGNVTPGTTILKAMEKAAIGGKVEFAPGVRGASTADAIVVVVGEEPYAETSGDRKELGLSRDDLSLIKSAQATGKKVVVVLITGRPMPMESVITGVQGVLVVWLPGSEGDGVADVLFGDYKPTGKLSHSWPRSSAQIPINQGDAAYAPQFPYGFGLSY